MQNTVKKIFIATCVVSSFAFMSKLQAAGDRDPLLVTFVMDKMELSSQANTPKSWDSYVWIGKNWHKIYLKSEGEEVNGKTESENKLLYSYPIEKFWDIQVGAGYDTITNDSQSWGVISLQGLSPYFFEIDASLLVNDKNTAIMFSAEYELLFTQRLILSPEFFFTAYANDDKKFGIGSGLSTMGIGIRLRYEFSRKFAPYIGFTGSNSFGKTADYIVAEGSKSEDMSAVMGLRFWF